MNMSCSMDSDTTTAGYPRILPNCTKSIQTDIENSQFMKGISDACYALGLSSGCNVHLEVRNGVASELKRRDLSVIRKGEVEEQHETMPNAVQESDPIGCTYIDIHAGSDNSDKVQFSSDSVLANILKKELNEKCKQVEVLKETVVRLQDELVHLWSFSPDYCECSEGHK